MLNQTSRIVNIGYNTKITRDQGSPLFATAVSRSAVQSSHSEFYPAYRNRK